MLEQIWSRPTCEVNGIIGGYTGAGFKTVIPSRATAKVSFRLVGDQDPDEIAESFRDFVRARVPADCSVNSPPTVAAPAFACPSTGRGCRGRARRSPTNGARTRRWSAPAARFRSSATSSRILGMDSLMIGFSLDDDRIHSPNEKYDLASFRGGIRSWARVLAALAE